MKKRSICGGEVMLNFNMKTLCIEQLLVLQQETTPSSLPTQCLNDYCIMFDCFVFIGCINFLPFLYMICLDVHSLIFPLLKKIVGGIQKILLLIVKIYHNSSKSHYPAYMNMTQNTTIIRMKTFLLKTKYAHIKTPLST